ncbi:MAG: tetratricopeptide repeat protein [Bacteroidales bacterium]
MKKQHPKPAQKPSLGISSGDIVTKGKTNSSNLQLWFIFLFSIALYANTLTFNYTLDDSLMITENAFTKKGLSGIKDIMVNDAFTGFFGVQKKLVAGGRYRPLSQVMFAAEYEFFGLNPFFGHLLNVLLYAVCGGLLFIILRKLLSTFHHAAWYRSLPFVATLLFVSHPLHTEVVANIKGRDEILSLLGSLLSLYLFIIYSEKRRFWLLPIIAAVFFLALLAKENAITFIAIIPLCLYYFRKTRAVEYLWLFLPLLTGTVAYLLLRYHALGYLSSSVKVTEILNDPYVHSSLADRLATNTLTWGIYLKLLLFPHPLTHDYYPWHISITNWSNPLVILSFLAFLLMFIVALAGFKKKSILSFSIFFFLITFSISSNLVFNIGTFMNERFMFVPLLGFSLVTAWFFITRLQKVSVNPAKPHLLPAAVVIILCFAYSAKTFSRNFAWKDDYTLFTTDVKTSHNSAKCNVSAGGMSIKKAVQATDLAEKEKLLNTAEDYLRTAIKIYPGNSAAWVLLGNVYLERKDYDKAAEYYVNCLNIANKQTEALSKLRYVAYNAGREGQPDLGIRGFKALVQYQPDLLNHYVQLADIYSRNKRADTAVQILENLMVSHPEYGDGWGKLGEIYGRVYNDVPKSLQYLEKAYAADPKSSTTLENLGICYGFMQDYQKSLDFFLRALELNPEDSRLLTNIANSYRMIGNNQKAEEYFRKASAVNKKDE